MPALNIKVDRVKDIWLTYVQVLRGGVKNLRAFVKQHPWDSRVSLPIVNGVSDINSLHFEI